MKIVLALTGASSLRLGLKLGFILEQNPDISLDLILSKSAKVVMNYEQDSLPKQLLQHFNNQNINIFKNDEIHAACASGSYKLDAMMIVPCSINTIGKIASGIADNLITRTALVMLKEQRKLLLAPREMPFDPITLENLTKLAALQVHIAPPVLAYYADIQSLEAMEDFIIGKWLDLLNIEHKLFKRWASE